MPERKGVRKMWIPQRKLHEIEQQIADLKQEVEGQQEKLKIISEALCNIGCDINHVQYQVFQKQS